MHDPMRIGIRFTSKADFQSPEIVVGFHTTDFVYIASTSTATVQERPDISIGENYVECVLEDVQLMPGVYCIRLGFIDRFRRIVWYGENLKTFKVSGNNFDISKMPELGLVDLPFAWGFDQQKRISGRAMDRPFEPKTKYERRG